VGKTSAVEGAKDLELDVSATEEEWMRQASAREKKVFQLTERGLQMLSMLRLDEAVKAFDAVFDLKPDAYLWQAGIARFYLGDLDEAAAIFSRCAGYYESRFLEPASEERIWRNACLLKKLNGLSRKEIKQYILDGGALDDLLPKPPDRDGEQLPAERRRVFRIASDLFASSFEKNYTKHIVARAQLQIIGGALDEHQTNNQQRQPRSLQLDRKMWKISSWFYLGLHYDVLGDIEESKKCMKRAILLAPNANGRDITHSLPMLHMTARDWFDDEALDSEDEDDFSDYILPKVAAISTSRKKKISSQTAASTEKPLFSLSSLRSTIPVPDNVDPVVVESILFSLNKMRYVDLQAALKVRGLRAIGSKEVLQGRLFRSLLSDTGLMP
jgi:tetratricopeptide (TPR) repeat protein